HWPATSHPQGRRCDVFSACEADVLSLSTTTVIVAGNYIFNPDVGMPSTIRTVCDREICFRTCVPQHRNDRRSLRRVEGFPDLVVHGPLLAIAMADLVRANTDRTVAQFDFRLRQPVFVGDTVSVDGNPDADSAEMTVISGDSTVHASAT